MKGTHKLKSPIYSNILNDRKADQLEESDQEEDKEDDDIEFDFLHQKKQPSQYDNNNNKNAFKFKPKIKTTVEEEYRKQVFSIPIKNILQQRLNLKKD